MTVTRPIVTLLLVVSGATAFAQDGPMSAIPWLTESLNAPVQTVALPEGPAVTPLTPIDVSPIATTTISQTYPDSVGLLPRSISGLAPDLWGPADTKDRIAAIAASPLPALPALQELQRRLLLAELDAPVDADARGQVLLARIDKLLEIGALDEALALLERAGPDRPEFYRRYFDVALLTGAEDKACARLAALPALNPTYPVRIFCQARNGDWAGAVLTYSAARALGLLQPVDQTLLAKFLDPELFGEDAIPALPEQVTPLTFKLFDAVDTPLPTTDLPRAFSHADLASSRGWKSQLDAAERLARVGAIDPARLIVLYTERGPAASGGVWDRAEALQQVELHLTDPAKLGPALVTAHARMGDAGLLAVLSQFVNDRIEPTDLSPDAQDITWQLAMLGPGFEAWALDHEAATPRQKVLAAVARGGAKVATDHPLERAVLAAFDGGQVSPQMANLLGDKRTGEAIYLALAQIDQAGPQTDAITQGLSLLRRVGLEQVARRTALQLLVLSPPS